MTLSAPGPARCRYTVLCRRVGAWWALEVPQVPAAGGWAAAFERIGPVARAAIAAALGAMPLTLGVWCWCVWWDDLDGLGRPFDRLRWLGPGWIPGQEPGHLAFDLPKNGP